MLFRHKTIRNLPLKINLLHQQVEPDGHGPGRLPAVPAGGAAGAAPAERRGRRRPHPRPPPHRQGLLRPPHAIPTGMDAILNIMDSKVHDFVVTEC